jgi:tight adherence protein B
MQFLTTTISIFCLGGALLLVALHLLARQRQSDLHRLEFLLDEYAQKSTVSSPSAFFPVPGFLARRFNLAGWEPKWRTFLLLGAGWFFFLSAAMVVTDPAIGLLAGGTLVLLAWAILSWRAQKNLAELSDSMLGVLERIRQLLSVGNSLSISLQRTVENSSPAVSRALMPTVRRINNGGGLADSLERCAADLDLYELHLLATATRTNLRFGGSMTSILRNIIENIRKRAAIERELRSNTAQIRASAWVLGLLPIVVASVVMLTNRTYAHWFIETTSGHHMIYYSMISQALGAYCMRMITRTRY